MKKLRSKPPTRSGAQDRHQILEFIVLHRGTWASSKSAGSTAAVTIVMSQELPDRKTKLM